MTGSIPAAAGWQHWNSPAKMDHSKDTTPQSPAADSPSPIISNLGRLLAIAGAVVCCFLLYRFAQGFWERYNRPGRRLYDRRPGRPFSRKDILYSRVASTDDFYDDEDEGYHDAENAHPPTPKSWLDRPLPDKPLPPLPSSEAV